MTIKCQAQACFFNAYAVEDASRLAEKLSFVILNLSFEIFRDEFFISFEVLLNFDENCEI